MYNLYTLIRMSSMDTKVNAEGDANTFNNSPYLANEHSQPVNTGETNQIKNVTVESSYVNNEPNTPLEPEVSMPKISLKKSYSPNKLSYARANDNEIVYTEEPLESEEEPEEPEEVLEEPEEPEEVLEEPEEVLEEPVESESDEEPLEEPLEPNRFSEPAETIYMEKEVDDVSPILARVLVRESKPYRFALSEDDKNRLKEQFAEIGLEPLFRVKGKHDVLLYRKGEVPNTKIKEGVQGKLYFMLRDKKDTQKKYIHIYLYPSNYPGIRTTIIKFFTEMASHMSVSPNNSMDSYNSYDNSYDNSYKSPNESPNDSPNESPNSPYLHTKHSNSGNKLFKTMPTGLSSNKQTRWKPKYKKAKKWHTKKHRHFRKRHTKKHRHFKPHKYTKRHTKKYTKRR